MIIKDRQGNKMGVRTVINKIIKRIYSYFLDFELMLLRWSGYVPLHVVRRAIYRIFGVTIGKGSTIHMWANFFDPRNISIGEDTIVGDHAFLDGRASLEIGNHVDIASEVMIYNSQHDVNNNDFQAVNGAVKIEDYVFIGPRVIILPGVRIGKGAVVAAGAVVTKNVENFDIVGGVPASVISKRKNTTPSYKLGRARLFQ